MSSAASWANTSTATHWPSTGRSDWSGGLSFGPPAQILCDPKTARRSERVGDRERIVTVALYTERAGIKIGDRILIGSSAAADPIAAGAVEVIAITEYQDTLDGGLPDYYVEAG